MLGKVFSAQVCQLILGFDVVSADLALPYQLLYEKVPQRDVLCARTVDAVVGDMSGRRIVGVHWHAAEALVEVQLGHHVGAEHHLFHYLTCLPTRHLGEAHGLLERVRDTVRSSLFRIARLIVGHGVGDFSRNRLGIKLIRNIRCVRAGIDNLFIAARAAYSAGNVPSEPRGYYC